MLTKSKVLAEGPSPDALLQVSKEWQPAQEDEVSKLEKRYAEWAAAAESVQHAAAKRLYENKDVCPIEVRFHLQNLSALLFKGQNIVLTAIQLQAKGEVPTDFFEAEIAIIDGLVPVLVSRLNEWHGTIDSQTDIPDSLKKAFAEAKAGEVIPFPA